MKYSLTSNVNILGKVIIKPDKSFSFLSYLIKGEKNVLIDTVPERATSEFIEELTELLPLHKLDALILNHSEEDHSGALKALLKYRPDLPVYCTPACSSRLTGLYPEAHFICMENGRFLELGSWRFRFTHTPGLHWEDNMVTYFENENILFSNDLFGQSLGAMTPMDTEFTKEEIIKGAGEYFERVFAQASISERAVVLKLIADAPALIAPGHGVVLTRYLKDVKKYYSEVCTEGRL